MRRAVLVVGAAVALLWVGSGRAATLLVPEEYATIQAAIDAAAEADSIVVGPGVWSADIREVQVCSNTLLRQVVACLRPGLTIVAASGPTATVLDGGTYGAITVLMSNVGGAPTRLEGFTITGGGTGVTHTCADSQLILANCVIADNRVRAIELGESDLVLEDCVVADNGYDQGPVPTPALFAQGGTLAISGTRFEGNARGAIFADGLESLSVHDSQFVDHPEGRAIFAIRIPRVLVERTLFLRNRVTGRRGGAIGLALTDATVEFCTFAYDSSISSLAGAVSVGVDAVATLSGNTFYRCYAPYWGSAVTVDGSAAFSNNVVVECEGAALSLSSAGRVFEGRSGCNVLWNEVNYFQWPEAAAATDLFVDPQFCNPEAGDFTVAESSPCLPESHFDHCGALIGAFGTGCPATGIVPLGFRTVPDDLTILLDDEPNPSPWLVSWPEGSIHEIGVPPSPILPTPETRYTFQSWSDGGAEVHSIVTPQAYTEYVAAFAAEYFLTVETSGGGTVGTSGWVPRGESREVFAVPDSAWAFVHWVGAGEGSYSGTENPVTVTLENPISQTAVFRNDAPTLTMVALEGGTITPETGRRTLYSVVPIEAFPAEGWAFSHWIGQGQGSYSGPENPTSVMMNSAITQTAVFVDATPLLTMNVVGGGSTEPPTGPQSVFQPIQILAIPDLGWEFQNWTGTGSGSYSGINNPAVIQMNGPITQTANFVVGELPLTMLAEQGGTVTPESGDVTSFTDVEIEAIPDPGYRFVQWKGEGDGSYTGTGNPAIVTLNGPITQVAHFEPASFSATLSLSATDPYVHTGGAIGLGNVNLWVTCGSTERGLQSIALRTAGSLQPLAFLPAPGVSATGTSTVLASIDGCPDGPVRLGSFLVNAPGEGSLCLDASGAVTGLTITDCEGATYSWPDNVGFVGVHTGGGSPCGGGTGCEEIGPFAAPVGAPDVAAPPSATRLAGIFPNPFGSGTTIHFDVQRSMDVRLTAFDVSGRQVRVLREGNVPAGRHAAGWDGRDSGGRAVAGGVYFVRLTGDGVEQVEKVTVVRGRP